MSQCTEKGCNNRLFLDGLCRKHFISNRAGTTCADTKLSIFGPDYISPLTSSSILPQIKKAAN